MKGTRRKTVGYVIKDDPVGKFVREAEIVYDSKGRKKRVILPYRAYKEAIEFIEDMDDLKAMKEAESGGPSITLEDLKRNLLKKLK